MGALIACHKNHCASVALSYCLVIFTVSLVTGGIVSLVYSPMGPVDNTTMCYQWSYSTDHFGEKCYQSNYVLTYSCSTPCACIKYDFSVACLGAYSTTQVNVLLVTGLVLLFVGILLMIGTICYIINVSRKWRSIF